MPELVELKKKEDIDFLKTLFRRYHRYSAPPGGAAARHHRFFVLVEERYWVAGAWLHDNTPFRFLAEKFGIESENSYFIRRLCEFAPGGWLAPLLRILAERLREEGKACLWTFGLDDYFNSAYKQVGFGELGKSPEQSAQSSCYGYTKNHLTGS